MKGAAYDSETAEAHARMICITETAEAENVSEKSDGNRQILAWQTIAAGKRERGHGDRRERKQEYSGYSNKAETITPAVVTRLYF